MGQGSGWRWRAAEPRMLPAAWRSMPSAHQCPMFQVRRYLLERVGLNTSAVDCTNEGTSIGGREGGTVKLSMLCPAAEGAAPNVRVQQQEILLRRQATQPPLRLATALCRVQNYTNLCNAHNDGGHTQVAVHREGPGPTPGDGKAQRQAGDAHKQAQHHQGAVQLEPGGGHRGRAGRWAGSGQVSQVGGKEVPWSRLHAQQQAGTAPVSVRDVARCERRVGVARTPSSAPHQVGSRCFRLRAKRTPRGAKKPQPMISSQMWACGAGKASEGQSVGETYVRQWCPSIMQLKLSPAQHCRGCWFRVIPALLTATRALTGLEKVSGSTNSPEVRFRVAVP